jgi:hypothetical protein
MRSVPDQPSPAVDCRARALALWPGIDPLKLRRTHGEPERVATLIERRTTLPRETIVALLTRTSGQDPATRG